MHSQRANTMKKTLHCPGVLGQGSYSLQNMFIFFPMQSFSSGN